jgi:hypothetical protein
MIRKLETARFETDGIAEITGEIPRKYAGRHGAAIRTADQIAASMNPFMGGSCGRVACLARHRGPGPRI